MPLTAGESLPKNLELTIRNTDACPAKTEALTTEQLFAGKRSVIFAVPGAFTSTCRSGAASLEGCEHRRAAHCSSHTAHARTRPRARDILTHLHTQHAACVPGQRKALARVRGLERRAEGGRCRGHRLRLRCGCACARLQAVNTCQASKCATCSLCVLWVSRTRVAVNDAVVMREWGMAQKVEGKVMLLADADGSFRFALSAMPLA